MEGIDDQTAGLEDTLGPRDRWPPELRVALGLCLEASHAAVLWWGPARLMFCNAACRDLLGEHVRSGAEGPQAWPGAWATVGPALDGLADGRGAARLLDVATAGRPGTERYVLSLTPLRSPSGEIRGAAGALLPLAAPAAPAEARSPSAEPRLQALLQTVPSMTFEGNPEGGNTFASEQWCEYTGMTPEETAGSGWSRAIHPDDLPGVALTWAEAMRSGRPCETRHRIRAADGSWRWFMLRSLPVRDASGRIERWVGSLTDIHEQLATERALRDSERRYRLLVENLPDVVFQLDLDLRFLYASPRFEAYTGIPPERLTGRTGIEGGLPAAFWEPFAAACSRALASGAPRMHRSSRPGAQGTRHLETRLIPVCGADGRFESLLGITTDISERLEAEAELCRLAQFPEENPNPVLRITSDGSVTYANAPGREFLAAMGSDGSRLPPDLAAFAARATAQPRPAESEFRSRDGRHFACTAVHPEGESYVNLYARDATERRRAEIALRESERKYRELVQNANSAIIRWRRDGALTFFNEYAQEFFGYRAEEVLGRHVGILVPDRESDGVDLSGLVQDIVANPGRYASNVNENVCRDGRRVWMAWTNRPIPDEAGEVAEILAIGTDITAVRELSEALRAERDRSQQYLDTVEAIIVALDGHGRIRMINRKGSVLLGYEKGELEGRDWFTTCLPQPDGLERIRPVFDQLVRGEGVVAEYFENPVLTRSGETRLIAWHNRAVRDDAGRLEIMLSAGEDITDRHRAEELLRQSEADLRRAQAVGRIGSWRLDVRSGQLTWSAENHRIFGIAESTPLTYETFLESVHPDDRSYVDRMWRAGLRGEPYDIEHRLVAGEQIKWVREKAQLEFGANGELLGGFGTTQDITDIKLAEQALRESEERFQLAAAIGRSGTWDWDMAAGKMVWSRGCFGLLGYAVDEVEASYRAVADRVLGADLQRVEREMREAREGRREFASDFRIRLPDGTIRWMSARARFEYGKDGGCRRMLGVIADVTDRKLAEDRLTELNERLARLVAERTRIADERAAHLRQLAAELTWAEQRERDRLYELLHDHVQPLLVAGRLALSSLGENSPVGACLRIAAETSRTITDALETARSLAVELKPPLVRDRGLQPALEWLARRVRSQQGLLVSLDLEAGAEPPDVSTRLLCFKAVRELLMNVVKHAGVNRVEVSMLQSQRDRIRIRVSDRGAGFDPELLRANLGAGDGSGLLDIRRRLEMIGASMSIDSTPGAGTSIALDIPLRHDVPAGSAGHEAPALRRAKPQRRGSRTDGGETAPPDN